MKIDRLPFCLLRKYVCLISVNRFFFPSCFYQSFDRIDIPLMCPIFISPLWRIYHKIIATCYDVPQMCMILHKYMKYMIKSRAKISASKFSYAYGIRDNSLFYVKFSICDVRKCKKIRARYYQIKGQLNN